MNKKVLMPVLMSCVLLMTSCGANQSLADLEETPISINKEAIPEVTETVEDIAVSASDEFDEPDEVSSMEEPVIEEPVEPQILDFVDVFGVHYETEILEDVPKYNYDYSLFQRDGEKLSYVGDPAYTSRLGIDVSYHQGNINWTKVADAGVEFAILRVAYRGYGQSGSLQKDKKFDEYIQGAQAAGLDVGVYIFSQAISVEEAEEEANFVLKCLEGYEIELPVVYDPESILDAPARTDDVTGEQFTANTLRFCEVIEQAGYEPMIYSNMLWEAFQFDMSQTCKYPYWYADYEPLPQTPYDFVMWQYLNTGKVPGIAGEVDLDIIFDAR